MNINLIHFFKKIRGLITPIQFIASHSSATIMMIKERLVTLLVQKKDTNYLQSNP